LFNQEKKLTPEQIGAQYDRDFALNEVMDKFNLQIDHKVLEQKFEDAILTRAEKEAEMHRKMPIKSKFARKSNILFNKRIAMEQGNINSMDGRIFGNESIRKKQEFDKLISS
jgi:hypothetical protein